MPLTRRALFAAAAIAPATSGEAVKAGLMDALQSAPLLPARSAFAAMPTTYLHRANELDTVGHRTWTDLATLDGVEPIVERKPRPRSDPSRAEAWACASHPGAVRYF